MHLQTLLGARQILWLENGHLAGDDTDAHIDTLARLCPEHTILYQSCDDATDAHYPVLAAMADELQGFRTEGGTAYHLRPLPWPQAVYEDGHRLPATYANFLIINGAVLVPTYNDPNDQKALEVVGLGGFQTRKTKELSGGEIRRVALARVLSLQPKLLLLDEPTANLDPRQEVDDVGFGKSSGKLEASHMRR